MVTANKSILCVVFQVAEAFNDQLVIDDIDAVEDDNPQLCTEYAKDIYRYLRELEVRQ